MSHLTFKRKDGVVGVGFLHDLGSHKVYTVAWPDIEPRKYMAEPEEMERMGVELVVESAPVIETHWMGDPLIEQNGVGYVLADVSNFTFAPGGVPCPDDSGITIAPDGTVEPTEGNAIIVEDGEAKVVSESEATAELNEVEPAILPEPAPNTFTEAQAIREYLGQVGLDVSNRSVVEALKVKGVAIKSSQVTEAKEALRKEIAASAQSIGS